VKPALTRQGLRNRDAELPKAQHNRRQHPSVCFHEWEILADDGGLWDPTAGLYEKCRKCPATRRVGAVR